jgi:hypothetical protein
LWLDAATATTEHGLSNGGPTRREHYRHSHKEPIARRSGAHVTNHS